MSEISPAIWEAMLKIPGWTPPTEATVLRAIMEGRAKVLAYSGIDKSAICVIRIGEMAEDDWEDACDMIEWFARRQLGRIRAKRDAAPANTMVSEGCPNTSS